MSTVAVAACTSETTHTYIAKEKLVRAVEGMGHTIHVEAQGTIGIEDELTAGRIKAASIVVPATDIAIIGTECLEERKTVKVPTNVCMKAPEQLIQEIEAGLNE